MHIVWMLVIGLAVGAAARVIMPGRDPGGIVTTIALGVAGSLVAGFIGRSLGWYEGDAFGAGFLVSVVGAVLLLLAYRLIGGSRWSSVWRT
jgi:uncharacterized membrane protein YeaQ/YmgE (transglycosylase-associated protein family)